MLKLDDKLKYNISQHGGGVSCHIYIYIYIYLYHMLLSNIVIFTLFVYSC